MSAAKFRELKIASKEMLGRSQDRPFLYFRVFIFVEAVDDLGARVAMDVAGAAGPRLDAGFRKALNVYNCGILAAAA